MSAPTDSNPFVGLRPFERDDSLLYFGRGEQVEALLELLNHERFLAVVGSSGCGKSSLVRAGLIPALEGGGFLVQDQDRWRIAAMKPGEAPVRHLAAALLELASTSGSPDTACERPCEESSPKGAPAQALAARLPEEGVDAALDILATADGAEATNAGQFLVPRLSSAQRRQAIEGPVRLTGGRIAPRLVDKLLNESLDTRDDLPILQHLLMRVWDTWSPDPSGPIDLPSNKS